VSVARLMRMGGISEVYTGFAQFAFQVWPKYRNQWRFLVVSMQVLDDGSVHAAAVFGGDNHGEVHEHIRDESAIKSWHYGETKRVPPSPGHAMRMLGFRKVVWDPDTMGLPISDEVMARYLTGGGRNG